MRTLVVNGHHYLSGYTNALRGLLWSGEVPIFDIFNDYKPERVLLLESSLTIDLAKALNKFKPKVYLHRLSNQELPFEFTNFQIKPGFDNIMYKPCKSDFLSYIGTYHPELDFLLGMGIKIFGRGWPTPECVGMCTAQTENMLLGGYTLSLGGDRPFKALGVGGKCLTKYNDGLYNLFGDSLEYFQDPQEIPEKLKLMQSKEYKFDITPYTYESYCKELC